MGSTPRDYTFNFDFSYIITREDPRTVNLTDFTTEVEDKFIRDAVSKKYTDPDKPIE